MDSQDSTGILRGAVIVGQNGDFSRFTLFLTPNRSHTIIDLETCDPDSHYIARKTETQKGREILEVPK